VRDDSTTAGADDGAPPLDGVTVLDIGHLVAGPMVSSILGDFGARVIKVERPGAPDPHRKLYQKDGIGLWARVENRNKDAITLDLKSERGKELFRDLLAKSDVLVENFLPGVLERLGFAPETLWETHPRLIVCRVSGWGQTGPRSSRRGYGRTGEAGSGFSHLNGEADGPPMHSAVSLGDTVAALWGAFGVVTALRALERDGKGQVVDIALYEGLLRMIVHQIVVKDQLDRTLHRIGNENPGVPTVNMFRCGDGKYFTVSNATPRTQAAFIRLVGLEGDPKLGTIDAIEDGNRDAFNAHVRAWMEARDVDEVDRLFHEAGAVGTPVWSGADLIDHPHAIAREMVVAVADSHFGTIRMPGVVPKLSRTPGSIRASGQEPGESNAKVYEELLGFDAAQLAALEAEGVI
jgi:crotonobetainyl-CoA:carnitine CoA-transferase CaiB-like acyl-CoA transferase